MSNDILTSLLSDYEQKKRKAEINFEHQKVELYKKIPRLQEIEDEGEAYESIEDIWPDYPTNDEDFFFNEDEY